MSQIYGVAQFDLALHAKLKFIPGHCVKRVGKMSVVGNLVEIDLTRENDFRDYSSSMRIS